MKTLLVCNKHDDTLSFVDWHSGEVEETIAVGPNPHEIVVTPDRRFAFLSNYAPPGDTISVIDLAERKHISQISTGEFTRIHGAAITSDGSFVYFTAGQTGFVVEVDTATKEVTRGIETHGEISHMVLVSPDDTRLYTANIESQNVSVIDRKSGELITQIPCGKGVEGIGFTPDGKTLWALNQEGDSVCVIDIKQHEVSSTFVCVGKPVRVAFAENGSTALIPSWTKEGELVIIDVESQKEKKRLSVGSQAIGVIVAPDGTKVFVGCEHDDGVHVVDLETLTVVGKIMTGDGSDAMAFC